MNQDFQKNNLLARKNIIVSESAIRSLVGEFTGELIYTEFPKSSESFV